MREQRFDSTWAAGPTYQEMPAYVERRTPQRATIDGDVLVPLLQALSLGFALGLAAGTLVLLLGGPMADLRGGELWSWAGRIAGGAAAVTLAVALVRFIAEHRALLWQIESMTGRDLDGDGEIGEPETVVRVELVDKAAKQVRYVDLPLSDDKVRDVARACLRLGAAFSRPALCDDMHALSQAEYHKLAGAMVDAGLARDLPGNKRELTGAGRAVLGKWL